MNSVPNQPLDIIADAIRDVFGNGACGNYLGYTDEHGHPMTVTTAMCHIAEALSKIATALEEMANAQHPTT